MTDPSGTTTLTWDARNRLAAVTGPGLTVSFAYDAFGRRGSKTVNRPPTQYLYDGLDIVHQADPLGATSYLRGLNLDEPLGRSGSEFYLADALGSILGLIDSSGAPVTRYTYDPFGQTAPEVTPSANPFQFTGRENGGEGMYYYRARYYSPTLQRFVSEDPLYSPGFNGSKCIGNYSPSVSRLLEIDRNLSRLFGFGFSTMTTLSALAPNPQSLHLYTYAENNPVNKMDPEGLRALPQIPGCDRVGKIPGFLQSNCAKKCCNTHDDCYLKANAWCDAKSWLPGTFYSVECSRCNLRVMVCLSAAFVTGKRKDCE